jgi:flagellar basal body-associated protein FliL
MAEKKEKGKGVSLKIIIIILAALIVFGGGFGAYWFLLRDKGESTDHATTENHAAATDNTKINMQTTMIYELSPYTYALDEFLVNLADEGGKRYLKVKIVVGYDTKKKKEMDVELEEKKPILKDAIISILRSKKSTDLATEKNVDDLKKELLTRINLFFEYGRANNMYFEDLLIQ